MEVVDQHIERATRRGAKTGGVVAGNRIDDVEAAATGAGVGNPLLREAKDRHVFDPDGVGGEDVDTLDADGGASTVDVEIAQDDVDPGAVNGDAVDSGCEDRGGGVLAIDGDRLGDGDDAVGTRIETVDFAAVGGLCQGVGKGLAGRRSAADVDVIANTGDPGPGRLGVGR